MVIIDRLRAREILDSRGNPTVEVDVALSDGSFGRAAVPSGASTGVHEALELRDGEENRYLGKGVRQAVGHVGGEIFQHLKGESALDQAAVDQAMLDLDGTKNKSRLGANAILGVSLAVLRAAAQSRQLPLYQYVGEVFGNQDFSLPQVMFNVLNGGKHADWATDVQEFFVIPKSEAIPRYSERLRAGVEVYHALKSVLKKYNYNTGVGDEGGFAPSEISSNTEAIEILLEAVKKAGYQAGEEIVLGFDAASTEFYENGKYQLKKENKELTSDEWIEIIEGWCESYPIYSLEDMLAEDDWEGWQRLMSRIGDSHQLVGDDLLVTNPERVRQAIDQQACNSLLVKVNQIGTLSETFEAIRLTQAHGWTSVFSHRSGETEDSIIADLVVGTGCGQIKSGAPARGERTAKYNQLLRIEEELR